MSLGRPNGNDFIAPEIYISNQAKIEQARKLLEEMEEKNRIGLQRYTEREQQQQAAQRELQRQKEELQRKIQEGLEAQRLIQELEKQQLNLVSQVATPDAQGARIEEVDSSNNQIALPTLTRYDTTRLINPQFPDSPVQSHTAASNGMGSYSDNLNLRSEQSSFNSTQNAHQAQVPQNPYASLVNASDNRQFSRQVGSFRAQQPGQFSSNIVLQQPYHVPAATSNSIPQHSQFQQHIPNIPLHQQVTGSSFALSSTTSSTGYVKPYSLSVAHVPYLNLTDDQVLSLRRRFENWRLQAPPGTMDNLNELIVIYKDSENPPTTWIYVPSQPRSTKYYRTRECDKFFAMLLQNARELRMVSSSNPTPHFPTMTSINQSTIGKISSAAKPAEPNIQRQNKPDQPASSTSTVPSVPPSTSVQPPANSPITPSALTRNVPPLSQVDKKHLSKNILFALGKRSRTSLDLITNELPTKRHASEALHADSSATKPPVPVSSTGLSNTPNSNISNMTTGSVNDERDGTHPPKAPFDSDRHTPSTPTSAQVAPGSRQHVNNNQIGQANTKAEAESPSTSTSHAQRNDNIQHESPTTSSTANPMSTPHFSMSGTQPSATVSVGLNHTGEPGQGQESVSTSGMNIGLSGPSSTSSTSSTLGLRFPTMPLGVPSSSQSYSNHGLSSAYSSTVSYPAVQVHPSTQTSDPTAATSRQKEPLFLPSASASPERGVPRKHSVKSEQDDTSTLFRNSQKKNRAYVLAPRPPEYLVRHRQWMSRRNGYDSDMETTRQGMQGLRTRTSSVSSFVGEEVTVQDLKSLSDYGALSIDERARVAVRLASSRMQELPCRWDGCTAKLNSVKALIRHLDLHKPEPTANERHFTCRWTQCGRRCSFDERHLEKHATLSLRCAFKDCNEVYRSGTQLLKHFDAKHRMSELKPSAQFSAPNLDAPPPVPDTVPAYLFATRLVKPATTTPERHELLCRWVVKTIVNSDQEKPTRLRMRKTAKNSNPPTAIPGNEYEFMTARSTRYSSYLSQAVDLPLEDLDSASISRMMDDGLTLWPPEGNVDETVAHVVDDNAAADSATMPPPQPVGFVKIEANGAYDETVPDQCRQEHSSDEDVVAVMLTER